jgi:hypothetical protein
MSLKEWKEAFVVIYKNFYQGRGAMLLPMILFAIVNCVMGSFVIFASYQGFLAWYLFFVMIFALVFVLPAAICLIDCNARKKRSSKLSEIRVIEGSGCDGFS